MLNILYLLFAETVFLETILFCFRRNNLFSWGGCGRQLSSIRSSVGKPFSRIQLWFVANVEHVQARSWICILVRGLGAVYGRICGDKEQWVVPVNVAGDKFCIFWTGKRPTKLLLRLGRTRREWLWYDRRKIGIAQQVWNIVPIVLLHLWNM